MGGGWRLHGYVVEGLLGQGGSGEVWRARVAATGEKVALKRLPVRDEVQVRRATGEAAKLTVLEHPHLVRLHALVPDETAVVLVLDLAEGGSLADLLTARGRLTPGEVITAIAPVAAALAHVHAAGVVHGDVTPANILFTAGGNALLADLGVARLTGDEDDAESTPAYVDPGVAVGGIPSELSDVFMLGATALHALTGEVPWPGSSSDEALQQARTGDLGDLPTRLTEAGVPAAMIAVLCRALDRSPGRRGTAAAFALDLRHSGVPVAVELDAGRARREPALRAEVPPAPTETRPRRGRHAAPPPTRTNRRGSSRPVEPEPPVRIPPSTSAETPTWSSGLYPAARSGSLDAGPGHEPASASAVSPVAARPAFARPVLDRPVLDVPVPGVPVPGVPVPDVPVPDVPVAERAPDAPPPTSRVHPRPRPQIPRPPRRPLAPHRPRVGTVLSALLIAVALAGAGLIWSRHLDTSAGAQPPAHSAAHSRARSASPATSPGHTRTTTPTRDMTPTPTAAPTPTLAPIPAPVVTPGSGWPQRVLALDALRGRAFAERRPELLRGVYSSPTLLQADTALLLRIVPAGCGLPGVRSHYRDLRVATARGRTVVTARVSLPATTLRCAGVPSGRAPAVGPMILRLTLAGPPASARIADERRS